MSDDLASTKAAQAIVRRLQAKQSLETEHPEELVRELVAALGPYERAVDALTTSVLGTSTSLAMAQSDLQRRAVEQGTPLDEEGLPEPLAALCALMLESPNVDELFVDDAELAKVVRAALLDYLPSIAAQARTRLAVAFVKPRATQPAPPRAAPSIADDGYVFPLFEGLLENAVVDDEGPCAFCGTPAEVRFATACYACFREGKAAPHTMVTETGEITDELLRTPKYETWQGERWLFCCKQPMVFIGRMSETLLERLREREQTQEEVVGKLLQVDAREAHRRTAQVLKGRDGMYVFRCTSCAKRRAHWDSE